MYLDNETPLVVTMRANSKPLLVTLSDKNYITIARRFFSSVYFRGQWPGDCMLLAHGVPEKELKWFRERGILIKKCKPLGTSPLNRWPPVVLDSFYLFTKEFKQWDNIVFFDSDTIVFASLNKLSELKGFWSMDNDHFNDTTLEDHFDKKSSTFNLKFYKKIKHQYDLSSLTFSTSCIAFSTDIIQPDTFSQLKNFIPYLPSGRWAEELAYNLVFYRKWKKLAIPYIVRASIISQRCGIKIENVKGIAFHVHPGRMPWSKDHYYSQLLDYYLRNIDTINLKKPVQQTYAWPSWKLFLYQLYLNFRYLYCLIKR